MNKISNNDNFKLISDDLQTQWQDHFHMRDQTWKVLQYSILFFLGVVGLEFKVTDKIVLTIAWAAVILTNFFGVIIAFHHRRQKEKFKIIEIYERELGLYSIISPVLKNSKSTFSGKINTASYIIILQIGLFLISLIMLIKLILGI